MPEIQLLTNHQRQLLAELLELTGDKEKSFTLTGLEGFLFGLAITPDMILPSEWISVIFGEETPEFKTAEQLEVLFKNLMEAYNAYNDAFHKGTLHFPFNDIKVEEISEEVINEIEDWTYGFLIALMLRPEIWYLDYLDYKDEEAPEHIEAVSVSLAIIFSVVSPEKLFEKGDATFGDENRNNTELILKALPLAVETLKAYGKLLWTEKVMEMKKGVFDFNKKKIKIGRNDPCPCGSGKKYKKCCGKN